MIKKMRSIHSFIWQCPRAEPDRAVDTFFMGPQHSNRNNLHTVLVDQMKSRASSNDKVRKIDEWQWQCQWT